MPSLLRILRFAAPFLLASSAPARVVERLDLRQMVGKADAAVLGTIVEATASEFTMNGAVYVATHLKVRGENLYTGREDEVVVSFLGGQTEKSGMWCAESPTPRETRVGNRVVVFSKWSPTMGGTGMNSLYAAHGGLFHVETGPKGDVVMGRGEGYAIEKNVRAPELRERIAAIRAPRVDQRP
ncbi:MAG TPA: hypothetical protein VFI25_07870 [Planctomycetota bacterium]|jgi:hypothetical protein|nr:hypothetical protein [Planctomycetota bacterium]